MTYLDLKAVVVAMVAHLTLDLPYALVAIDTTDDRDDYFVLGELMIEITPNFLDDLLFFYDTDAEDILHGFFFGDWVDGVYGQDTTITLSYQTIRTKSWNNRWLARNNGVNGRPKAKSTRPSGPSTAYWPD